MNEIANVCEMFGADVDRVRQAVGSDRRIGTSFLFPGVGYGGSCFPKDVKALIRFSADREVRLQGSEGRRGRQRPAEAASWSSKLEKHFGSLKGRTIAIWGLAFKPKTDDMREAPAVADHPGAARERREGAGVTIPEAMKTAKALFGSKVHYAANEL